MNTSGSKYQAPKVGDIVRVVMLGKVSSVDGSTRFSVNGEANIVNAWASHVREVEILKPSKPEEPLGLGASVRTADGSIYIRFLDHGKGCGDWQKATASDERLKNQSWHQLDVVEVLHHGKPTTNG